MNRLPEQVVAWHNRHPLALRITVSDIHTVGIVALPFMRSGHHAAVNMPMPAQMIEPVLGDDPAAAKPAEAPEHVRADEPVVPQHTRPVFSERFLSSPSVRRISRFAQAFGFAKRPGEAAWPMRVVAADEQMIADAEAAGAAWPLELFLLSAAIDASEKQRTRVLIGQGPRDNTLSVIGRRCLSPLRIGGLGLALLLLVGVAATAIWWPHGAAVEASAAAAAAEPNAAPLAAAAASATPAASAASAPLAASDSASASAPEAALASDPAPGTQPDTAAAREPASAPQAAAASEPSGDIRPRLVERAYPPRAKQPTQALLSAPSPASDAASQTFEKGPKAQPDKAVDTSAPSSKARDIDTGGSKTVVALVGPPSSKRADAEAMLERLRAAVGGVQGKSGPALQATVFQTPQGWCAAVWPFASREEAQIINATLVARGMRTRAVDF